MITAEEKKERISGAAATAIFHLLLLLLFILLKLPAQEIAGGTEAAAEGILIDFGNTETGTGNENAVQENQNTQPSSQNTEVSSERDEKIQMQNTEDAISVSPKTKTKTQTQVTEPGPDQDLLSALNKLNNPGKTSGDGNSNVPGNQGSPDGTTGPAGTSEGTDPSGKWKIKEGGRKMIGEIEIDYDSQETGIVAVEIIVDKYGKVTRATPVLMGSTTTNLYLWNKAKEGLQNKILFNQSPSGEEARGTIYINFTLR